MHRYLLQLRDAFRKGDLSLLLLCLVATAFGCLMNTSAINHADTARYLVIQIGAAVLCIFLYVFISSVDAEFFTEHRNALVIFNTGLLLIPLGETISGNRSWLNFPFLPFNIQPAEIYKKYKIRSIHPILNWIRVHNGHKELRTSAGGSYMTKARKTIFEERVAIARACIASGRNYGQLAVKYNVSYQQVYAWANKYAEQGKACLKDRCDQQTSQLSFGGIKRLPATQNRVTGSKKIFISLST